MGDTKECELDLAAARAWVSDDARWPSIRDFLWDFAPQVHPSWLDGLTALESLPAPAVSGAPQLADLMSSPRAKAFVLSSLGIGSCFHTFPKEDGSRLLLLDSATLESLAKWLGALACADSLRKVMDGATVRALKAALPGIYPEVFSYMAYFRGANMPVMEATCAEDVVAAGVSLLFSVVASLSPPLLSRLQFKFPKAVRDLCGEKKGGPSGLQVVQKLLKLKFPEAYQVCFS